MSTYSEFKKYISAYLKDKLAHDLFYHGYHHTLSVMSNVLEIAKAEKIGRKDILLLKIAVWLHDVGFTKTYSGHEDEGKLMARKILPNYNLSEEEIDIICGMIEATKIPQKPTTILEQILADADLLYLGTNDFKDIGETLYQEMKIYVGLKDRATWNQIQKKFLETHSFHTNYCIKKYEPKKRKNLKTVVKEIEKIKPKL
ncbi:MAG: HD domain-containing protein [Bacteroidetes bacterium]|nr:HD domain-containing protein [Bacteroidota bacterium]